MSRRGRGYGPPSKAPAVATPREKNSNAAEWSNIFDLDRIGPQRPNMLSPSMLLWIAVLNQAVHDLGLRHDIRYLEDVADAVLYLDGLMPRGDGPGLIGVCDGLAAAIAQPKFDAERLRLVVREEHELARAWVVSMVKKRSRATVWSLEARRGRHCCEEPDCACSYTRRAVA